MIKMGLPKEVVKHAMTRDELDPRYVCLFSFAFALLHFIIIWKRYSYILFAHEYYYTRNIIINISTLLCFCNL